MFPASSPRKKPISPGTDVIPNVPNPKTSVTCTNVPDALFETTTAKKHFSKFGRVQKIRLIPKRQACIVEYDQPMAAERAVLNAGAFDGFMFDVTRTKPRMRRKSKREDDPDWIPDSDVEEELSAMSGAPSYRMTRQKPMDLETEVTRPKMKMRAVQQSVVRKNMVVPEKPPIVRDKLPVDRKKLPNVQEKPSIKSQPACGRESPVVIGTTQTTLSTFEAAAELHQLRSKVSLSPDEQWRILDARDRILRNWGGAGSRVKVGGATIGTCQDMCPEKELLHRQAEHQIMTLETVEDSDYLELERWRAVKQYSRSSADQEIPMCYELRPASVLMMTCSYMLHEIADTTRQVTLADWFHFMWDRFRSIRKDITQQALCCAESIRLVEMCARFHAHCAARLADLEHTQFDQKLNTDNLTKCLQTLKHMYADVTPDQRPREAEFRGYIALLNLGDANFWWEIKQLPREIQKSAPIVFAIQVFNALDNNNYVRFFRLVQQKATYLQACILLRYFNDVRARALARIVKAYAPRGGSRFPASDLMSALAFESVDNMKSFINHYGLRFGRIEEHEPSIILSRHQFIEDSDPFPIARAINLIESKRQCSVGEVIAGGPLPNPDYSRHVLHSSFTMDGKLKETALVAEEQGFNTVNDSNKDVKALKAEIQRLAQGGRSYANVDTAIESKGNLFLKPETKGLSSRLKPASFAAPPPITADRKLFSFKPAIMIEPTDVIKNSPEKVFDGDSKNLFSFSKPQETAGTDTISRKDLEGIFTPTTKNKIENKAAPFTKSLFDNNAESSKGLYDNKAIPDPRNVFEIKATGPKSLFQNTEPKSMLGGKTAPESQGSKSLFENHAQEHKGLFVNKPGPSIFQNNVQEPKTLFENSVAPGSKSLFENKAASDPKNIFGRTTNEKKDPFQSAQNVFTKPDELQFNRPGIAKSIFGRNVDAKQPDTSKNVFLNNTITNNNHTDNQVTNNNKSIFADGKEKSLFASSDTTLKFDKGNNIFAKPNQETQDAKQPPNIFAAFNKASESKNIFTKQPDNTNKNTQSIFAPNGVAVPGKVSPGTLFKNVLNPTNSSDTKSYTIFQSKNIAQTVADNIRNSVNPNANNTIFEFNHNEAEHQNQLQLQHLNDEKLKEEERKLQQQRQEEERKQQELRREQELRRQEEMRRQEELRQQEEIRRQEEARRKQKELRLLEEQRRKEEQRKQEVLKRRLEEERKTELKRLAEEERKFRDAVEMESKQLTEELINEISHETNRAIIKEEQEKLKVLMTFANDTTEQIVTEFCKEICHLEMKAEMFLTFKIMRKWFHIWRQQLYRNLKRRRLLEDTPVWLPERTPIEEASHLRRTVEDAALKNMNDFHKGFVFSGELKQLPPPQPYNLMELIKSPLLKRIKQINYPYDKCFFWKVTLVAPGEDKWFCRKINVQKWLIDAFSDKKKHEESETLIHVGKESWNNLMDFAISVSLVNTEKMVNFSEAVEGTNGVLFYATEKDINLKENIQKTLEQKYPYQVVPVAVIMPKTDNTSAYNIIQNLLASYLEQKIISGFKIFILEPQNINKLLNESTKRALRWLARKYPEIPPLEIDSLKSLCQRYLGNEIWCRFRTERDGRMGEVLKDIQKLIRCYNAAVDRLTFVITNEDLFNYSSFPLEFKQYLDHMSPFPKPYEFIPSNVRTSENVSTIRDILRQLKLPNSLTGFNPLSVVGMQQQIRKYCHQIGWFENPEEVVCKVVAVIPNELSNANMSNEDFTQYFAHYDLVDFLNIIVYEKINRLNRFDNRFALYEKSELHEFRNIHWLYEVDALSQIKHKAIEYEDDLDYFIEAKRRKIAMESLEYLMLEDKDSTLVEENIKETDANITKLSHCSEAVKQLEKEIEDGKKKSIEFENMLKAALADV